MEQTADHNQPKLGRNLHPVNALNDIGALQRMIREMIEPEARKGEKPTYRKPFPAYIDQMPLSPRFKPEVTISDLAALKQIEDEPAQDFITRFDGMLFGDLAELADKASKYEELLRDEQHKRNSSKGTYYKTPSSSVHLVEVETEEGTESSEERESLCVPSTLHQQLALWHKEARYYHDDLGPFTFFGVNQNGRPCGVMTQKLIEEGLASSPED
ncbi:unnamed protein product [Prunus brigantina]